MASGGFGPLLLTLPDRVGQGVGRPGVAYGLAGQRVECSSALPALAPFQVGAQGERRALAATASHPLELRAPGIGRRLYLGPAWIGRRWRQVECVEEGEAYALSIDGFGVVRVGSDGARASVEPAGPLDDALVEEAALGPTLTLALALRGVFSLHASAVVGPSREVFAFAAPSGSGKSTLARLLDGHAGEWSRAADDMLPVAWSADGLRALPRFPQLKLAPDAQPGAALPERLPLAKIFVLLPGAAEGTVRVRPLGGRDATLALVRHTAAARLFAPELLERHLETCARMAAAVPVAELSIPWTGELPPGLPAALATGPEAA